MAEAHLEGAIARASADGTPLALVLLDLDGFKDVNDSFGHEAGDEVLRAIAGRLRGGCFADDFVARLGGDEFVLLATRPRDCAEIESFVAKLLRMLRYRIDRDGEHRIVSATIGVARWENGASAAELLRSADLALYAAKRDRRGTGRIFGEPASIG